MRDQYVKGSANLAKQELLSLTDHFKHMASANHFEQEYAHCSPCVSDS